MTSHREQAGVQGALRHAWWKRCLDGLSQSHLSRAGTVFWLLLLFVLAAVCILPFIDPYYDYVFEDNIVIVDQTHAFVRFFLHGDISSLPPLSYYPPYYDGPYIVYALGAVLLHGLHTAHMLPGLHLANDQSFIIFSIRYVNASALIAASIPFFFAAKLLSRNNIISFLLSLIFVLSPPILQIDLLRIDHMIVFLLCCLTYLSMVVAQCRSGWAVNAGLGIALAGIANTKITGITFALMPAAAIAWACFSRRYGWRQLFGFLIPLLLVGFALWFRYLLHAREIVPDLLAKIHDARQWEMYFPVTPYYYYNWTYFTPFGWEFLTLFAFALMATCGRMIFKREGAILVILISLAAFSALLAPLLKYPRGGYPLIPLYLLVMASGASLVFAFARSRLKRRGYRFLVAMLVSCSLIPTLFRVLGLYHAVYEDSLHRMESIRITRIEPREWFKTHVASKAKIGIIPATEFACPPIWDLDYAVVVHLLAQPNLSKEQLLSFDPPSFEKLETETDLLLFPDYLTLAFKTAEAEFAPEQWRTKWRPFFDELRNRYTRVSFHSRYSNYFVSQIEMYVVNPSVIDNASIAFKNDPSRGLECSEPLHGAQPVVRKAFSWLGLYEESGGPWIIHDELGSIMLYPGAKDSDLWFYSRDLDCWFWTNQSIFPSLFRPKDKAWLYYNKGSKSPRVFYNSTTNKEERYP